MTTAAASARSTAISCSRRTATARRTKWRPDANGALSIFDVRHRIVSSILYELPFGAGKKWAQEGVGGAILGGWQITNILSLSSGFAAEPEHGHGSREHHP